MFIYYNGFWNGFHSKEDPVNEGFFTKLISMVFNQSVSSTDDTFIGVLSFGVESLYKLLKAFKILKCTSAISLLLR